MRPHDGIESNTQQLFGVNNIPFFLYHIEEPWAASARIRLETIYLVTNKMSRFHLGGLDTPMIERSKVAARTFELRSGFPASWSSSVMSLATYIPFAENGRPHGVGCQSKIIL